MKKTQSQYASEPRDSDDESQGAPVKSRERGPEVEQAASSKGKGHNSASSSNLNSTKDKPKKSTKSTKSTKSKKPSRPLAAPSEDEAPCFEPEAQETECELLSEFGMPASSAFDDDELDDLEFDFHGADLHLEAWGNEYWVHTHVFEDFANLNYKEVSRNHGKSYFLLTLEESAEDVHRVLRVLYRKPYQPQDFTFKTLESCLKLATRYENRGLRAYAIQKLERRPLEPIEAFRLGRDYGLPEWRSKSVSDLSKRDEPLAEAEARTLGPAMFSSIAAAREKLQYAKGHQEGMAQASRPAAGVFRLPPAAAA